jgi:hypothetical protein
MKQIPSLGWVVVCPPGTRLYYASETETVYAVSVSEIRSLRKRIKRFLRLSLKSEQGYSPYSDWCSSGAGREASPEESARYHAALNK